MEWEAELAGCAIEGGQCGACMAVRPRRAQS